MNRKHKKCWIKNHTITKLKIASAIGKIKSAGVDISAPDINRSTYTFSPDVENNTIRYGLSGITRIGQDLIHDIMENRPYKSVEDFVSRIKCTKPQVINLIKSGAFDVFGEREEIMHEYVNLISDTKKRITLKNMKMLIDFGLLPDEFDLVKRVFNFNKYIKKMKKGTTYYGLDKIGFDFYSNHFDVDLCSPTTDTESGFQVKQIDWDKIYQAQMDKIRPFIKSHQEELLNAVNNQLTKDVWNKYCEGSISKWEMDSISCYIHEHELSCIDEEECGFDNFSELPNDPEIDRYIPIKGKMIPLFKLHRIAGTVLDRDKAKKTVTLLTTSGVVTVKIFGNVFAQYDKQISERGADGKKHVQRKSEFARGNKIVVIGVKDGENEFRAKKYSKTPYHLVETIGSIEGNHVIMDNRNDEEIV